ncbi:MAG: PD-(D/E)XK nuclease family protein [Clostridia bacterium]|nr:PD-(D/E)XK nuclease family protein [Clostridia bacterium]
MKLRVISGRAGGGKSHQVISEISSYLKEENRGRAYLIVPEQFMINAEKRLMEVGKCDGLMDDEVLSFKRLAYRCFKEAGIKDKPAVTTVENVLIMLKTLTNIRESLLYYRDMCDNDDFTVNILKQIAEFERYLITPEMLTDLSELPETQDKAGLSEKLKDLALIYRTYRELLTGGFTDSSDENNALIELLQNNKMLAGAKIWIDEFHGFTGQEYKIIEEMVKQADEVSISLCMGESNEPVFEAQRKTYNKLKRIADKCGAVWDEKNCDIKKRYRDNEYLIHVENSFFKYPYKKMAGKPQGINVRVMRSPFDEVMSCAEKIKKDVAESGGALKYSDISIILSDMDSYGDIVETVFSRSRIPFFMDSKKDPGGHPYAKYITLFLQAVASNWDSSVILDIVRMGLFTREEEKESADYLELYHRRTGLKGKAAWKKKVKKEIFDSMKQNGLRGAYEGVEELRKNIAGTISKFEKALDGCLTVRDACLAIADFVKKTGVKDTLEEKYDEIYAENAEKAAEFLRGYDAVNEVLKYVNNILGDIRLGEDVRDKADYLTRAMGLAIAQLKVGYIPATMDCVQVGTKDRSRSHEIEQVYLLGANDGLIPRQIGGYGIISDDERRFMESHDMETAGDDRMMAINEQFNIYTVISLPRRELNISYAMNGLDNKNLEPSAVVDRMLSLFEDLEVGSDEAGEKASRGYYSAEEELDFGENGPKEMYMPGGEINTSFSAVSKYSDCPFQFYLANVLKLVKEDDDLISDLDYGVVMHSVLENAVQDAVRDYGSSVQDITEEDCKKYVEKYADDLGKKKFGNTDDESELSNKIKFVIERMKESAASAMKESLKYGMPVKFEERFGGSSSHTINMDVSTEDGRTIPVRFRGQVDRLDLDDGKKVTIIDYKGKYSYPETQKQKQQLSVYLQKMIEINGYSENGARLVNVFYDSGSEKKDASYDYEEKNIEAFKEEVKKFAGGLDAGSFSAIPGGSGNEMKCDRCDYRNVCRAYRRRQE